MLWDLLGLPLYCLCLIVPLRVRLWVGLHERVRLCDCGDGCVGDAGVGVDSCICSNSISGGSDGARV